MIKENYLPLPIDIPLLFERIVLELSTFSAKGEHILVSWLPMTAQCASVWFSLLTHYDDGVPATAGEVRHMMEGAKDRPWHGRAHL